MGFSLKVWISGQIAQILGQIASSEAPATSPEGFSALARLQVARNKAFSSPEKPSRTVRDTMSGEEDVPLTVLLAFVGREFGRL